MYFSEDLRISNYKAPPWSCYEGLFEYGVPVDVIYRDSWGSNFKGTFDSSLDIVTGEGNYMVRSSLGESITYNGNFLQNFNCCRVLE
jgi:hypothetical protein